MEHKELKPCPFCGSKVEIEQNYLQQISVQCYGCGVKIFVLVNDRALRKTEEVITAWNRRAKNSV